MYIFNNDIRRLKYGKLNLDTFIKMIFIEKVLESYNDYAIELQNKCFKIGCLDIDISLDSNKLKRIEEGYNNSTFFFKEYNTVKIYYQDEIYEISSNLSLKANSESLTLFYRKFGNYVDLSFYVWDYLCRHDYKLNFSDIDKDPNLSLLNIQDLDRIEIEGNSITLYLPYYSYELIRQRRNELNKKLQAKPVKNTTSKGKNKINLKNLVNDF